MDKEDVIYTHTQCNTTQSFKKITILPFAATWMDWEGIMLSEISQAEKDIYLGYHLYVEFLKCNCDPSLYHAQKLN